LASSFYKSSVQGKECLLNIGFHENGTKIKAKRTLIHTKNDWGPIPKKKAEKWLLPHILRYFGTEKNQ